jgi:hypothetical protein
MQLAAFTVVGSYAGCIAHAKDKEGGKEGRTTRKREREREREREEQEMY